MLYTGQYNKENVLPVPVFGTSIRELSGQTEENLGFVCDFTSENKEEKTNRHYLNPSCRPFFAVCVCEVSSKKNEGFLWCLQVFRGC